MNASARVRGAHVALLDSGPRDAPTLVALHGYPDTAPIYARLAHALEGVRVIAPDWPGQGESAPISACAGPTERAAWVRDLLDELGITRCTVFGHDMGALPALALARDHGDRVASVIVANALLANDAPTSLAIRVLRVGRTYRLALPLFGPLVFARSLATFLDGPLEPELEQELRRRFVRRTTLATVTAACTAYDVELRGSPASFAPRATPTFALWGTRDRHFPIEHAHALRRVVPDAELTPIAGGHWMVYENVEAVAARIAAIVAV